MEDIRHGAEEFILAELKSSPEFIPSVIACAKRVFAEEGKTVTPFHAEGMANAVLYTVFAEKICEIMQVFNFPVIDFLVLRDGIKKMLRGALVQEQLDGANTNVRH